MTQRSAPPILGPTVEDFVFDDDAPPSFASANDNGEEGPQWVWVLVRVDRDPSNRAPHRKVWIRFAAEQAPSGLHVRAARAPRDGEDGVLILPKRRPDPVPNQARPGTAERSIWISLLRAAEHLGESPESLRKKVERAAVLGSDGQVVARVSGIEARKFGRNWKLHLPDAWRR